MKQEVICLHINLFEHNHYLILNYIHRERINVLLLIVVEEQTDCG